MLKFYFRVKVVRNKIFFWIMVNNFGILNLFIIKKNFITFLIFENQLFENLLELGFKKKKTSLINYKKKIVLN